MATENIKEVFFVYTIVGMFLGALGSNLDGNTKEFFKFTFSWFPMIIYGVFFSKKS